MKIAEGELIIVSIISLIGMVVVTQLWQMNWFRRENFKIKKFNIMSENKLKLKKLERELGISGTKFKETNETSTIGTLGALLPLLKELDSDTIAALADKFLGGEAAGSGDVIESLFDFATKNPDVVEGFLEGMKQRAEGSNVAQEGIKSQV